MVLVVCAIYGAATFVSGRDKYCPECEDSIVVPVVPFYLAYCLECSKAFSFDQLVLKTDEFISRPENETYDETEDESQGDQDRKATVPRFPDQDPGMPNPPPSEPVTIDSDDLERPPSF